MLDVNFEFRHGVFFVRLYGHLTSSNKNKLDEIKDIVIKNGIKFIAFNLENLDYIDEFGIDVLNRFYNETKMKNSKMFICNINKRIKYKINNSNITSYYRKEDNELSIMHNIDIIYNE